MNVCKELKNIKEWTGGIRWGLCLSCWMLITSLLEVIPNSISGRGERKQRKILVKFFLKESINKMKIV